MPATKTSKLQELRERGFVSHDELDAILDEAATARAYEKLTRALLTQLAQVDIRAAGRYHEQRHEPGRKAPEGYGFEFLLRGQAKSDPLSAYIREIVGIPRMEREDEVRLARRLEFVRNRLQREILAAGVDARAAKTILRSSRIRSLLDERDATSGFSRHLPRGPKAAPVRRACREYIAVREEFIERNLHLVVAAAAAYRTYGVPVLDLIQEGNAGLIRAVEKFDWRKNVRFRTYATFWIRQAIERAIAFNKGIVRVPNYLQQKLRRLRREGAIPRKNEDGSIHEVAKAFELPAQVVARLLETERSSRSLDAVIGEDGEDSLASTLSAAPTAEDERFLYEWEFPLLKRRVDEVLSALSSHERTILEYRYGLGRGDPMTLEEVGRLMNVSRERVRQLQVRAIRKLQAPGLLARLTSFV